MILDIDDNKLIKIYRKLFEKRKYELAFEILKRILDNYGKLDSFKNFYKIEIEIEIEGINKELISNYKNPLSAECIVMNENNELK